MSSSMIGAWTSILLLQWWWIYQLMPGYFSHIPCLPTLLEAVFRQVARVHVSTLAGYLHHLKLAPMKLNDLESGYNNACGGRSSLHRGFPSQGLHSRTLSTKIKGRASSLSSFVCPARCASRAPTVTPCSCRVWPFATERGETRL